MKYSSMIRAPVLWFICLGILASSRAHDDISEVPGCVYATGEVYLDLSNMNLEQIHKPIAYGSAVVCLNLAENHIGYIDPKIFDELPELRYLNLIGNPISYRDFARAKLPKLKILILDGPFRTDDNDHRRTAAQRYIGGHERSSAFGDEDKSFSLLLPDLEVLSLQNYPVDRRDLLFYPLKILDTPNLKRLSLSGNALTVDHLRNIMGIVTNLTHLYLDNNTFYSFDGISSGYLNNLRHLSIERNNIRTLGTDPYYGYRNNMKFDGMRNLESVSLAGNEVAIIRSDAFQPTENLRYLNLEGNKIKDFSTDASYYLANLRNLTLDYNLLTSVPSMCALKELRSLSMNGNLIASIDESSFCDLPKLSVIYLSANVLSNIADKTFGKLPELRFLDLSRNKIVSLPMNWIAPRNFIIELHLDANRFANIDDMSLKNVNGLESLSLGDNPIKELTIMSLMTLPNSTRIDVSRLSSRTVNILDSVTPKNGAFEL